MKLKLYTPHENQIKIHKSKARYRVAVCGRRFGKSALALNECIARCFQLKNQICWIILPLLKQAKEIYWIDPDITQYFMPYVTNGLMKIDNSELSLKVKSTNSWIRLKGSDNYEGLRGSGIDFIVWDEADDMKPEAYETIKPALADSPNHRVLYIGTPKGSKFLHEMALRGDHNNIIPPLGREVKKNKNWETWHYTSYDNKTWSDDSDERKSFIKYIEEQRKEAEERGNLTFFNQEYLASFEVGTGIVFKEFSHIKHVIRNTVPSENFLHYLSIDWGYTDSKPTSFSAYLHAVIKMKSQDGQNFQRVVTYKEWSGNSKTPDEWATIIYNDCILMGITPKMGYVDPAMHNTQTDGSKPIKKIMEKKWEDLNKNPWIYLKKSSNNRIARVATVHNWLSTGPDGMPYWMITESCKQLISTLPKLEYDEHHIEDVDTTMIDDPYDSCGYFLPQIKFVKVKAGPINYNQGKPQFKIQYNDKGEQIALSPEEFASQYD